MEDDWLEDLMKRLDSLLGQDLDRQEMDKVRVHFQRVLNYAGKIQSLWNRKTRDWNRANPNEKPLVFLGQIVERSRYGERPFSEQSIPIKTIIGDSRLNERDTNILGVLAKGLWPWPEVPPPELPRKK